LIKAIADHHDAHPNDYKTFAGSKTGQVFVTREGGRVRDVRGEVLRLEHRITDVIQTLEVPGVTEAKLVIGDGTWYVLVCME
jgi:hypothetical protein